MWKVTQNAVRQQKYFVQLPFLDIQFHSIFISQDDSVTIHYISFWRQMYSLLL